ncbi:nucleotide-binding universal stress UspA family protein [Actinomadura pelletieri DSM 43383]|uniref:Nucleotide-binding universal stress UspA family protein n=1 Tax=Actinomadura pelletieri DSM 43383 TaxID=1120940 RepID=A0A495QGI8_9ACTN|nr:universal stress protein [Actinomadura pelletieri]RKS71030.1 nucleotide-binding universal stress UspA family protein [Actinomadura pelletieri DSM 43383]
MNTEPITGVVVGYDGSEGSVRAVDWAADEARARGVPLSVLHAWGVYHGGPVAVPVLDLQEIAEETLNGALEHVRKVAPDLKVRAVLRRWPAPASLIEASRTADLLVLGPRGLGGFAGLVLGSVGAQVAAHAACPVIIVRGAPEQGAGRVVVGVDGSAASRAALSMGFAEADARGLSLSAVVAWDQEPAKGLPPLVDETGLREATRTALARLMIPLRELHPGVDVQTEVVIGSPREVLIAASEGANLLVVGSRGLGGFRGLVLGSVSHALVHHAPCPVAVVHAPDKNDTA